ncbi:MAG: UbiH/UbiF/VisC/COQ6 family ubiquinone biosynthesis hydroxylase [Pseudomonadota bacterium]
MKRHEIAVVGGGVVGVALALGLKRAGFDVALIERTVPNAHDSKKYDARVYALSLASAQFLAALGIWSEVTGARVSAYRDMRVWQDDFSQELHFSAQETQTEQLGWIVENSLLMDRLWAALSDVPRVVGTSVTASNFETRPVSLSLSDSSEMQADLVISAEGADSVLREAAGLDAIGTSYEQRAVVCHVVTEKPHQATAWQRFLTSGPLAFLPLSDGRSSIVWSADEPLARELLTLNDEDFCNRLAEASQRRLGGIQQVTPRLSFPLRMQHAEHYVREGFALAGDSAHVIHPLAGQGVNLGLADAAALIKTLTEAREKQQMIGSLRVLQRYERVRRAANTEAIALTDGLYRLFNLKLPVTTRLRELGMGAVGRIAPLRREMARRAMGI